MQCGQRTDRKVISFTEREYVSHGRDGGRKKLSGTMALILGVVLTVELMILGAMLFHVDFRSADRIALIFAFVVLYFGVVAGLTDR